MGADISYYITLDIYETLLTLRIIDNPSNISSNFHPASRDVRTMKVLRVLNTVIMV